MCGIAGILDFGRPPSREDVAPMVDALRHRGPDADGFLVDGPVALGMRRLSIIDLAGGDQPIWNEDRTVAVMFNGEVFNYVELRADLLRNGHRLSTNSDTETLVHLYEDSGPDFLSRLNGMFGFALWDAKRRSLLLVRDRMGVKPLYYAVAGGRFLFASEIKALLTRPELPRALEADALADYLRFSYVPGEATPYAAVRKLLPGHYLRIDSGGRTVKAWWDLAADWDGDPFASSRDVSEELVPIFDDAVRLRMRSDVPVASFLSGGVDSSLVTLTAQRGSDRPLETFTVAFEQSAFDETEYARSVAARGGTVHREVSASPSDAIERLPLLVWHLDEPIADSSIIPNFLISRFAGERVKVCLSGLGGDELFGGYSRYENRDPGRIRRVFGSVPRAAGALAPLVSPWHSPWGEELRLVSDPSLAWREYLNRLQIFDTAALGRLGFPAAGRGEETIETLWNRYPGTDPVGRRQFIDQHTYLPDQILALTDRMSMANSLEVRVPFMDYRLVRLAQRIPTALKQVDGQFKIALKQALGDRLPPELLTRPKWGFDTPLKSWVRGSALFEAMRTLPSGAAVREGLISAAAVGSLVGTPERVFSQARQAWSLLVLDVWLRVRDRVSPPRESLTQLLGRS
jgi:asparagine synthase (glutamine-hydrolysing)